jgi:endonuclease
MQRFIVAIPKEDGGVEIYPMKEWLRQHPDQVPPGLTSRSNSRHLGRSLRRAGWSVQETYSEIRFVPPGIAIDAVAVETVLGDGDEPDDELDGDDNGSAFFGLEHQLRDFIAQNIGTIRVNGKRLRLYTDASNRDGVEFRTAVGFIDILAVDEVGTFYVFELKRGRSPDYTMGQLTRYMGWVHRSIADGKPVNGVIVAREISESLRYAVSVVPNVHLFEYEINFLLKPATAIVSDDMPSSSTRSNWGS